MRVLKMGLLLAMAAVCAMATDYKIDPAHSSAQFAVTHMGLSKVRGSFGNIQGTISYDPSNVAATKVNATIAVATVNTNNERRDNHLKGADFFDVEKFPTMTFASTKVEQASAGTLKVTGDLTMKGVTKPVVLTVDGPTDAIKDQRGGTKRAAAATTRINRKDFGVTWNRTLDAGGVMVSDEVDITIDLQFGSAAQ